MNVRTGIDSSKLILLIRGAKKTGKTSLLRCMRGKQFNNNYEPTLTSIQKKIHWRLVTNPYRYITITIIEIVSNLSSLKSGSPNGIIILYDPRDQASVSYGVEAIMQTPPSIPIAVLTNFQDIITADLHPSFFPFKNRCHFICTSMATNLGMIELAKWIELPLSLKIYRLYKSLISYTNQEITQIEKKLHNTINRKESSDDKFWNNDNTNITNKKIELIQEVKPLVQKTTEEQKKKKISKNEQNPKKRNSSHGKQLNLEIVPKLQNIPLCSLENGFYSVPEPKRNK